jgi:hypothetical protein
MGDLHRQKQEQELIKQWEADVNKAIAGKRIVQCRYMNEKEMNHYMWDKKGIILILEGGITLLASADDEGNNAGSIFTNLKELPTIPTI